MTVSHGDLVRGLRDLGLGKSSKVLVHSSYKSFGGVEGGPATVVRAFVESLGMVMMPSFTSERTGVWDARGAFEGNAYPSEPWDAAPEAYTYDTPADVTMGIIVETFRTSYPVHRSLNPSASFIAYGEGAADLVGPATEYDGVEAIRRLMEAGGHTLLLGVTHTNSTAVHLGEKLAGRRLFVRYALTPDGVKAAEGGGCGAAFDDLQPHVEHVEHRTAVGGATLRCYDLQPYVEIVRAVIERDPLAFLCDSCDRCHAHRSRVATA